MSCGTCIRWRKRVRPPKSPWDWATRYGFCWWPGLGAKPYWHAKYPDGFLMTADTHGGNCPAFKEKKR